MSEKKAVVLLGSSHRAAAQSGWMAGWQAGEYGCRNYLKEEKRKNRLDFFSFESKRPIGKDGQTDRQTDRQTHRPTDRSFLRAVRRPFH